MQIDYNDFNKSHNPYFSRWFSAIQFELAPNEIVGVTILILVDGFLQLIYNKQ